MVSLFSMISRSWLPPSSANGVVTIAAFGFFSRIISTSFWIFAVSVISVRLSTTVPAFSIWLLKNSPKFFIYILHFAASTMVTALFNATSISADTSITAFITSESLPTPDGSIMIRSGLYLVSTSDKDFRNHLLMSSRCSRSSFHGSQCRNPLKSAVNTDLTKFIFNEDYLFTRNSLL